MKELDVRKQFEEIEDMYSDPGTDNLGCLISSMPKVGKTTMCTTFPKPVLIYHFDPRGVISIKKEIDSGDVFVVPFWYDDRKNPKLWRQFTKMVKEHSKTDFYKHFATVCIDSTTFALEALTHYVTMVLGPDADNKIRQNGIPFIGDYRIIYNEYLDIIKVFSKHDINVILTAHLEAQVSQGGSITGYEIATYNKLKVLLCGMFTENYAIINEGRDNKRVLITEPWGLYQQVGSQLKSQAPDMLAKEKPDGTMLMEKAGLDINNKPNLRKAGLVK